MKDPDTLTLTKHHNLTLPLLMQICRRLSAGTTSIIDFTIVFVDPMDEDVHGANLCQLVVVSEEPEDLGATFELCHLLHMDGWAIVPRGQKKKLLP